MKLQHLSKAQTQKVADKILAMLETGTAPWHKPWNAGEERPFNPLSVHKRKKGEPVPGHAFSGGNMWLAILLGVGKSRYWASGRQWMDKGVNIAGTKAMPMLFPRTRKDKNSGEEKFLGFSSYYVINASDLMANDGETFTTKSGKEITVEGNTDKVQAIIEPFEPKEPRTHSPIEQAETLLGGMRRHVAPIAHGGNRACYSPQTDGIQVPEPSAFFTSEEYYSTLFHECIHSTGHVTRVGRDGVKNFDFFGSHQYSEEELVAEFGACFLSSQAGIAPHVEDNSAAYLAGWSEKIGKDPAVITRAIDAARSAYEWTQGTHAIQKQAEEDARAMG